MYSIWFLLLIGLSVNIIIATNLRCNEDINGFPQLIKNCRACVIFIEARNFSTINITISPRNILTRNNQSSIEELVKHRRRRNSDPIIRQKCARESDGALYGYDQTHCYCNSNQCNSNIQRCIYEVTSKRHFSCYHGSNSNHYPLDIRKKCRSCRIRADFNFTYHYECLTFGEHEQENQTQCTCQYPMCNQDLTICQRFQPIPSQPRPNLVREVSLNSTLSTTITTVSTTITSSVMTSTKIFSTLSTINETEKEISALFNETVLIQMKNHENHLASNYYFLSIIFFLFHSLHVIIRSIS